MDNDEPTRPGGNATVFAVEDWCKNGRYIVVRQIGGGGMSQVYEAIDTDVDVQHPHRMVALKVLHPKEALNPESVHRVKAEFETLRDVDHPNLVRVFDSGIEEARGFYFYAMERLNGETLALRLERCGRLSLADTIGIALEICNAAHILSKLSVVHRDLKPENIFLTNDGRVVVLDLGVAKHQNRLSLRTDRQSVLGTQPWMSPEQCLGGDLDARSDVYAVAVIAYQCIAGIHPAQRHPGGKLPEDFNQWTVWHVNGQRVPLHHLLPWLHVRVWEVLDRALESKREKRYSSADAFALALTKLKTFLSNNDLLHRGPSEPVAGKSLPLASTDQAPAQDSPATARAVHVRVAGVPPAVQQQETAPHSSTPPSAPPFAWPATAPASGPAPALSRTAQGTEILRRPDEPPRTARGTEILVVERPHRPLLRPPAAVTTEVISDVAPTPPLRHRTVAPAQVDTAGNATAAVPRQAHPTPAAHAISLVAAQPPPKSPRALAAALSAGIAMGALLTASVMVFRAPHEAPALPAAAPPLPALASPAVPASPATTVPADAAKEAPAPSPSVTATATTASPRPLGTWKPAKAKTTTPRPPAPPPKPPAPKSERIVD